MVIIPLPPSLTTSRSHRPQVEWRFLILLERPIHTSYSPFPLHQPPRPNTKHKQHMKEIRHQRTTKDNRIVRPSTFLRQLHGRKHDRRRQHPEKVRYVRLVKIPSRIRSQQNSAKLRNECIEDIAPVNIPPHLPGDERHFGGCRKVVSERHHAPKRETNADRDLDHES